MKRVVIIGGGVIGLCAAHSTAKHGHDVIVLDRGGGEDGCSYGNAGIIPPSHFVPLAAPGMVAMGLKWMWNPESPFWVRPRLSGDLLAWGWRFWRAATAERVAAAAPILRDLHLASRECFEKLADAWGNSFGLEQRGLLMLCKTQHGLDEEARGAEMARKLGLHCEVLNARQTAAKEPGAKLEVAGSVYYSQDCHLTPERFMAALKQELTRLGVKLQWHAEVQSLLREGRKIVAARTQAGDVEGDEFVLCGGVWSAELARAAGLRLPMVAGKGYSLTLPAPRALPQLCSILTEARVAVTPMGRALRVGGTMEIGGDAGSVQAGRVRGITRAFGQYYPEYKPADFDGVRPWAGLRPCSPDGMPYLGRTSQYENLSVGSGHAMMGLSLGPVSGELLAQLIDGERPRIDLTLLSPDRCA